MVQESQPEQAVRPHLVSILVENRPGVLARVSALFTARGYNIEGLTAAHSMGPERSRISCVTWADQDGIERIVKQLRNLVDVVGVSHGPEGNSKLVRREMLLVRLTVEGRRQEQAIAVARRFGARTLSKGHRHLTLEATGDPDRLAGLLEALHPFGPKEVARSGPVLLVGSQRAKGGRRRKPEVWREEHYERTQEPGALSYIDGKE